MITLAGETYSETTSENPVTSRLRHGALGDGTFLCARIFETLHLIKRREEEAEQEVSRVQLSVNRSEPGHARMSTARSIAQPEQMANILFMRTA